MSSKIEKEGRMYSPPTRIYFFLLQVVKDENNLVYLHPRLGRLAQLVQSTSFTPRGSGVRAPHRPLKKKKAEKPSTHSVLGFFVFHKKSNHYYLTIYFQCVAYNKYASANYSFPILHIIASSSCRGYCIFHGVKHIS